MKSHRPRTPPGQLPRKAAKAPRTDEPAGSTPNSGDPKQIPPQWAWHYRTLLHLRDRLLHDYAAHAKEAATSAEIVGLDIADVAQEQSDRDLLWAELAAEDNQLFEVDCALQRIRDGVYGLCEETGHVIPPARLRAVPWTRYCRSAAETHETRPHPNRKPDR